MAVDLSYIKFKLAKLCGPASMGLDKMAFYKELKETTDIFEKDKEFKKLLAGKAKK